MADHRVFMGDAALSALADERAGGPWVKTKLEDLE